MGILQENCDAGAVLSGAGFQKAARESSLFSNATFEQRSFSLNARFVFIVL